MLCIVAAPEGLKSLTEKDPDVHIYTCAIDDHLNEAAYIVPGLATPVTASTARSSRWAKTAAAANTKKRCARTNKRRPRALLLTDVLPCRVREKRITVPAA